MIILKRKRKNKTKNNLKEWGLAFLLALILALLVKGFFLESYMVSSTHMEKTMQHGDFIFVNKLPYGARGPITLFSVPLIKSWYLSFVQLPYFRLPATDSIKRNDLVVLNYPGEYDPPIDKKATMIKRIVALPGDTLNIDNKQVFVNSRQLPLPGKAQFNYRVVTNGELLNQDFLNQFGITEGGLVSEVGIYDFPLSPELAGQVLKQENISYVRELKHFPGENSRYIFPTGFYFTWNKDYFGPVEVPYKGQNLHLNYRNIELYETLIREHENNTLFIDGDDIIINGIKTHRYTVKNNYYFVLDDNRDNARDSRYWGFLPESHIIGKASFIWFSINKNQNTINWDRVFSRLH
jgi:signal peptidase I